MVQCHPHATLYTCRVHRLLTLSTMKRIPLWNSAGFFALVDDADFEWLKNWQWRVDANGYAITSIGSSRVFMHAMLISIPGGCVVDHRNRNRTDNRRSNLRYASPRENAANRGRRNNASQPFVGVRQIPSGRWVARAGARGRHVGVFDTAEQAARARDAAVIREYGEFATLNFSSDAERVVDAPRPIARLREDRRRARPSDQSVSRKAGRRSAEKSLSKARTKPPTPTKGRPARGKAAPPSARRKTPLKRDSASPASEPRD